MNVRQCNVLWSPPAVKSKTIFQIWSEDFAAPRCEIAFVPSVKNMENGASKSFLKSG